MLCAALFASAMPASASSPVPDAAWLQGAPADGWAGQEGGTVGGGDSAPVAVANRAQLLAALARPGSRTVVVHGIIDMSEGQPFADSADQARRGSVHVPSETTLTGAGAGAGFINANLIVNKARQVIIRNLRLRNPCDVAPVWDADDGPKGNWNSLFDSITVSQSHHVWIDHNSFTDAPVTDDTLSVENGMLRQCHDGALDIGKASDFITVSYNHFAAHEKNALIGSNDKATGDEGHLRITYSHNLFDHVSSRAPRVRYGQVHLFNNYYVGAKRGAAGGAPVAYRHEYSIGVGKQARIISDSNVFAIAGARGCDDVVRNPGSKTAPGAFSDTGSLLNGEPLGPCEQTGTPGWTVPYAYRALPAHAVAEHVLARAGAQR